MMLAVGVYVAGLVLGASVSGLFLSFGCWKGWWGRVEDVDPSPGSSTPRRRDHLEVVS